MKPPAAQSLPAEANSPAEAGDDGGPVDSLFQLLRLAGGDPAPGQAAAPSAPVRDAYASALQRLRDKPGADGGAATASPSLHSSTAPASSHLH